MILKTFSFASIFFLFSQSQALDWKTKDEMVQNLCSEMSCLQNDAGENWRFWCSAQTVAPPSGTYYYVLNQSGCFCPCPPRNYHWFKDLAEAIGYSIKQ